MPPSRKGHMRVGVEWLGEPGLAWVVVPEECTIGDILRAALAQRPAAEAHALRSSGDHLWVRVGDRLRNDMEQASACGVTDSGAVAILTAGRTDL
jgi:hypothetical protein